MPHSPLRHELSSALVEFAWNEWAQMGVFSEVREVSQWAQDPEALILLTLEAGRADARLFDEALDWIVTNESLLSVRRLRALALDGQDERLTDALLGWTGRQRPRARLRGKLTQPPEKPELLFRTGGPTRKPDPDFASAGYKRSLLLPSGKSRAPDLSAPINLALRLRQVLGVGARSEAIRLLLTTDAPSTTANALAQSAGYAKRNVHEALNGLVAAGVVSSLTVGSTQRYAADLEAWSGFLRPPDGRFPAHRDWPQLLGALRLILRWLHRPDLESASEYIVTSHIRDLLEALQPLLAHAGVPVMQRYAPESAWDDLADLTDQTLSQLGIASLATEGR